MTTRLVVFPAFDGVVMIDLMGPLQAFAAANREQPGRPSYELVIVSPEGGAITSNEGVTLMTQPFPAVGGRTIDTLVIAGGGDPLSPLVDRAVVEWVAGNAGRCRRVSSACMGTFTLAASGLLAGRRATTHWLSYELFSARHPEVRLERGPIFVRDGFLSTSAGGTASIDLTLSLIDEDLGHRRSMAAARFLVVPLKRHGEQAQYSRALQLQSADDPSFAGLTAWVAANLSADLRVERLAEHVGMSPRSFARTFGSRTGTTPALAVEALRLEAARWAIEATSQPLKAISRDCGFGNEQGLRRACLRHFGMPPQQIRAQSSRFVAAE